MKKQTLKEWRLESGKTQEEVAKEIGATPTSIWRWEQSPEALQNATYKKIKALADAVGCEPWQFEFETVEEKKGGGVNV